MGKIKKYLLQNFFKKKHIYIIFRNCYYQAALAFLKQKKMFSGSVLSLRKFICDSTEPLRKYIDPQVIQHLLDPADEDFQGTENLKEINYEIFIQKLLIKI